MWSSLHGTIRRKQAWALIPVVMSSLFCAVPAASQSTESESGPEPSDLICTTIAAGWVGTQSERDDILLVPVPQSFRERFFGDSCTRFQLRVKDLVTWHLLYGDAQSVMAAVRFLENEKAPGLGPQFPSEFAESWNAAARDLEIFLKRERNSPQSRSDLEILRENRKNLYTIASYQRLSRLGERFNGADYIADQYTRAAEALESRALLAEAQRVHEIVNQTLAVASARKQNIGVDAFLAEQFGLSETSDSFSPEMREIKLAVTNAFITREKEAVLAADSLTRRYYDPQGESSAYPDLMTFIMAAYSEDDEVCAGFGSKSRDGYEERCEERYFESYALRFWYQRSRIELLADQLDVEIGSLDERFTRYGGGTPSMTIDLLIRQAWQDTQHFRETSLPLDAIRLLLLSGETDLVAVAKGCGADRQDQTSRIYRTLDNLSLAQSLAAFTSIYPGRLEMAWQNQLLRDAAMTLLQTQETLQACGQEITDLRFKRDLVLANAFLDQYDTLAAQK